MKARVVLGNKTGSYAEFQESLDDLLGKSVPHRSVPWKVQSPPPWSDGFRPMRIIDIGCAQAVFTSSVLKCLSAWGCLAELQELILVEKEPSFGSIDGDAAVTIKQRCREAVGAATAANLKIVLVNDEVNWVRAPGVKKVLQLQGVPISNADLILASHVTYYFEHGGLDFAEGVLRALTPGQGLAWFVIRDADSPIYKARIALLGDSGEVDDSPLDYSHVFHGLIHQLGAPARMIDCRRISYLALGDRPPDCASVAHLLMWRELPPPHRSGLRWDAAVAACANTTALFSETHFILGT